jgi:retron-type reverse transcriptase
MNEAFIHDSNFDREINGEIVSEVNGLPQGSLLSPHLFNLYLNDVFQTLKTVKGLLMDVGFADDMILVVTSSCSTHNSVTKPS